MSQVALSANVGISQCSSDCPFCSNPDLLGYKTKYGALKKETKLATNMRSCSAIDKESTKNFSGNFYPLPGGCDKTVEWEAKPGVFEDFPVRIPAAPHHLIPGNAAMKESNLEKWTCKDMQGSKLKEDIGYNIDCAQNGIFLPHLPDIYFTRYAPGTETPMSRYYGQTWKNLSESSKKTIAFTIMEEISLQIHFMDHSAPYKSEDRDDDDDDSYDDECITRCNQLGHMLQLKSDQAKCEDGDGKLYPPYGLVNLINNKSSGMKMRITGVPGSWDSWVSPLAEDFTIFKESENGNKLRSKFKISRITGS